MRIHPAPLPVATEVVRAQYRELAATAELACIAAWSDACRDWWSSSDDRLRADVTSSLHIDEEELEDWKARKLDAATLVRAQAHVTTTRAGVESDTSKRTLVTGFRDAPIVANHRDGSRTVYIDAREVTHHVAQLASMFNALPEHPVLRAAWLTQAIGAIHPFRDSNGGTSRFLSSVELSRAGLPPFRLTKLLREGPYIAALMEANGGKLRPLLDIFYESVHQSLANLLLTGRGWQAVSSQHEDARTQRWASIVGASWERALGAPSSESSLAIRDVLTRFARRGVRLPIMPALRCSEWRVERPVPLQLDLALAPVNGGNHTWLIGTIDASIGDGELGAVVDAEPVAEYFVAPSNEPNAIADVRFARWSAHRIAQCVRGLSRWL